MEKLLDEILDKIELRCCISGDLEQMRNLDEYKYIFMYDTDIIIPLLIDRLNGSYMWRTALRDVVGKKIDNGKNYHTTKQEWNNWYNTIYKKIK